MSRISEIASNKFRRVRYWYPSAEKRESRSGRASPRESATQIKSDGIALL